MARDGRTPLFAGNWKMNCNHLEAIRLVQDLAFRLVDADHDRADIAVLPPFTDLRSVQTLVDGDHLALQYGAQDVSSRDNGAHTGDISASMLSKLGCTYVVVGHSERRRDHSEDDALVAAKAAVAMRHGLVPIVCVGESSEIRQSGEHVAFVTGQLAASLADLAPGDLSAVVIAYEPVWAIGTGEVATPDDAQEVCAALRQQLAATAGTATAAAVRILYGGSMKPDNAGGLMAMPDVDGGLVGGASLVAEDFVALVREGVTGGAA